IVARSRRLGNWLISEPGFLPKEETVALAAVMVASITAKIFQKDSAAVTTKAGPFYTSHDREASYSEGMAAILCHFRHERHSFKFILGI
ncbi:MAG: hypothetical protein P8Z67_13655, partial [Gammaproteobacteria bacterium]